MRVAIVHDDLVQWGGAERVLLGLCEVYPDAPVYTSVFNQNNKLLKKQFESKKIITSFLQKIPGWKYLYKSLLPLYPIAFEQFVFDEYDLVVSNTTRFAKSIITKPGTTHISYCHTPPRFLWHFSDKKNLGLLEVLMTKLRLFDQISARRVDYFLAGSQNAKARISRVYKKDSKVVYPFIDLDRFRNIKEFDGGYMVVISRLNKYKKVDLAIMACLDQGISLKVIGSGPEMDNLKGLVCDYNGNNIDFLGTIDDKMVAWVLSGAKALIIPGIEDFGLVSLEAQALGKPVIAYKSGGSLETIINGGTGIFFEEQTVNSLKIAISKLNSMDINPALCKENANSFSKNSFINNFKQAIDSLVYT